MAGSRQNNEEEAVGAQAPAERRYVRVIEQGANDLVRFEFAVGWPDLSCELVLPLAAFDEFCRKHAVVFLDQAADQGINTLPPPERSQP